MKCDFDCFNCKHSDCVASGAEIIRKESQENLTNKEMCNNWYQRNKERKKAYQREYIARKRERERALC